MILMNATEAATFLGISRRTFQRRNVKPTATTTKGEALGWSEADLIRYKKAINQDN